MTPADLAEPAPLMDYADWLTTAHAAEALGCSIRTVQLLAKEGKLQRAQRRAASGQTVAVFHPDDVARLASARQPGPPGAFLVPDGPARRNGHGSALTVKRPQPADHDPLRTLAAALDALRAWSEGRGPQAPQGPQTPAPETVYVTLKEASAIAGLTQAYLRRLIEAKQLPAVRDPGIRVRRKDVEAL